MNMGEKQRSTLDDYLEYERSIDGKAEYYDGEIFDMVGGTESHSLLGANFGGLLFNSLKGRPCRVYNSDFKIALDEADAYAYADLFVICGETRKSTKIPDSATNPTLVVEVMSEFTALHDRSFKFNRYRTLNSLKEYVLVSKNGAIMEVFSKSSDSAWVYRAYEGLDAQLKLDSLDFEIPLLDLYANVELKAGS